MKWGIDLAKKKIQKTNAIRLVEQKKIAYKEHEYAWSEDCLLYTSPSPRDA